MKILAYKPGHDGQVAFVEDETLIFSIEAEKDSGDRYAALSPELMLRAQSRLDTAPDVLAVSGWAHSLYSPAGQIGAGYFGVDSSTILNRPHRLLGQKLRYFSSSHERSHILGSYALSPFPQGEPCYALVWEGVLGSFYRIDASLNVEKLGSPLSGPGQRYSFLYCLADPTYPADSLKPRREDAGKLMALTAYGRDTAETIEERKLIERLLAHDTLVAPLQKADFVDSPFFNIGIDAQEFRDLSRRFQNRLFERFYDFAKQSIHDSLPLLVSGGCGLNCDWNSAWRSSDLFCDVFVPPCANDSGSAIGTAVDAQFVHTGNAKLAWSVYAGEEFVLDTARTDGFEPGPCDKLEVARRLQAGEILAWVQGRYEIGPRALGNRSLLAEPFAAETHARLNAIKHRESFRPIAPIVLEDEIGLWFEETRPSPHMLYFQRAKTRVLKAVTHVDGSARAQTVTREQNPAIHDLLSAFRRETGCGVLCNTSLNFSGKGFINRLSDLARFARERALDGFIVDNTFFRKIICRIGVASLVWPLHSFCAPFA